MGERVEEIRKRIADGDDVILRSRLMPLRDIDITDYVESLQAQLADAERALKERQGTESWRSCGHVAWGTCSTCYVERGRRLSEVEAQLIAATQREEGLREALTCQTLAPLLATYECDEPHVDEAKPYYPRITWSNIQTYLAQPHDGDCVNQPQPCIRCDAEGWVHKANWIIDALLTPPPGREGAEG